MRGKLPKEARGRLPKEARVKLPKEARVKLPKEARGKLPKEARGKLPKEARGKLPKEARGKLLKETRGMLLKVSSKPCNLPQYVSRQQCVCVRKSFRSRECWPYHTPNPIGMNTHSEYRLAPGVAVNITPLNSLRTQMFGSQHNAESARQRQLSSIVYV